MNAAKILGKIIGPIMAVMVFVILLPIIILVGPIYIIIVGLKAFIGSAKNQLPAGEMKGRIMLDRVRHFRVTQYSFERAEKEFDQTTQQFVDWINKQKPYTAESLVIKLWFFLCDEDHDLTPEKVGRILSEYLAGGWRRLRTRKLMRAYNQYVGGLKEFNREFGDQHE